MIRYPDPWRIAALMRAHPGKTEREACAENLRDLAEGCIEAIDGGEECRGRDAWMSSLAEGLLHAAQLLEKP